MFTRLAYFRFFLAMSVVVFHLWRPIAPQAGRVAVMMFFFISGYLIAKLLSEAYKDRAKAFITNRFLRIYPIYWACAIFAFVVVLTIPEVAKTTNGAMDLPKTASNLFGNLIIFGQQGNPQRFLPPSWSLHVELVWYVLLFILYTAVEKFRVPVLMSFMIMPFIWAWMSNAPYYGNWIASGYAFALGALRYEFKGKIPTIIEWAAVLALPVILFATPLLFDLKGGSPKDIWSWLNLWVGPYVLFMAFGFFLKSTKKSMMADWAGSLSYPVFLVHWPCAALATAMGAERWLERFLVGTIITLIVSALVVAFVEEPLKARRTAIRKWNAA